MVQVRHLSYDREFVCDQCSGECQSITRVPQTNDEGSEIDDSDENWCCSCWEIEDDTYCSECHRRHNNSITRNPTIRNRHINQEQYLDDSLEYKLIYDISAMMAVSRYGICQANMEQLDGIYYD